MDKQKLIDYWKLFFTDLFVGTFKNLFLFGLSGFLLGTGTLMAFKTMALEEMGWDAWAEISVLTLSVFWYCGLGVFLALLACVIFTTGKKLAEMVGGIQDLLDLLTRGVVEKFPKFHKNIPRDQLSETFDNIGKDFLEKLKLKRGLISFVSGILFAMILKAMKFFFLDDVVEELSKKESGHITTADIEHAVRRVGVEMVLNPIQDNFLLLQILNYFLIISMFALPFGILLLF
ncbi:MAG: hypothetical protein V3U37_00760 [Nitrospinaceae bacterium]